MKEFEPTAAHFYFFCSRCHNEIIDGSAVADYSGKWPEFYHAECKRLHDAERAKYYSILRGDPEPAPPRPAEFKPIYNNRPGPSRRERRAQLSKKGRKYYANE